MAKYDYHCKSCNETTEIQHSMMDDPRTKCPKCGEETLQRQIGTTSFVLKGKGWFKSGGY